MRSDSDIRLPNIYIIEPSNLNFNAFEEILGIVKEATSNKTGRRHDKKSYDDIFIKGIWGKKSGDIIVLLDTNSRIPQEYEDILPVPWSGIEISLKEGKKLELKCEVRDSNIIVLAAPSQTELRQLIKESDLLNAVKTLN